MSDPQRDLPGFDELLRNTLNNLDEAFLQQALGVGSLFNPDIRTGTRPRSTTWTFRPGEPPRRSDGTEEAAGSTARASYTSVKYYTAADAEPGTVWNRREAYVKVEDTNTIDLAPGEYTWTDGKPVSARPILLPGPKGE